MMKVELEVVNYNLSDVITTSTSSECALPIPYPDGDLPAEPCTGEI